jgi:dTDP-4-amino-4,6-dideoxygalactose transaminase
VPHVPEGLTSVWAQYTVRALDRDGLSRRLAAAGVPTAVYYRKPLHWQQAYAQFPVAEGGCHVAERLSEEVLSLPMHPDLDDATQERIVTAVLDSPERERRR